MRYLSLCSGVEAATLAWAPLGWTCAATAEIEPFPSAVLAHHWPQVSNLGDMTATTFIARCVEHGPIDLIVGGTPCQPFSVAGLRGGLDDDRGNLALRFCQIVDRTRPRWVVWENVPGVLSSNKGRDFGAIVGALGQLGYGWAYRILDAQFFGVPQRRRRVFVVGYLGDWRPPVQVLFESESLQGHPAPRREAGEDVTPSVTASAGHHGRSSPRGDGTDLLVPEVSHTLNGHASPQGRQNADETFVVNARQNPGYTRDRALPLEAKDTGHAIAIRNSGRDSDQRPGRSGTTIQDETMFSLQAEQQHAVTVPIADTERVGANQTTGGPTEVVAQKDDKGPMAVRRLTPVECERLQGMPDNFTRIPWRGKPADQCPDGPRYRAIGNSMAVPVMRWLGERIAAVEAL